MKQVKNIALPITFLLCFSAIAFGQSGGTFAITQSVIASGGDQQTAGGAFSLDGTTGQSLAGENLTGGMFSVRGGFWLPAFAPTAAMVGVSGRVKTARGSGIRNVIVTLTDSSGAFRMTRTGSSSDKLTPADFTGDGKTDIAFFRPSTGFWFILRSEDFSFFSVPFGAAGDFDGDGAFDFTIFRPSNATWFIQRSTAGTHIAQFGITGDRPVPNAFVH